MDVVSASAIRAVRAGRNDRNERDERDERSVRPAVSARTLLLLGSGLIAAAILLWVPADPGAFTEPKLLLLLRGMALIKASMVVLALALCWWRLGHRLEWPIERPRFAGYCAALWAMTAASFLIWQLRAIPAAALLFHLGLFGFAWLAWRDGALPQALQSSRLRTKSAHPDTARVGKRASHCALSTTTPRA